ncbi:MAG TPA: hypothetical protein VD866_22380 [Urbifossiella sp.]|nr:hypothetical protein [Urbifossiella sp.]
MFDRNDGPEAGPKRQLYREFAEFYRAERCRWAPDNPRRVFNLAFRRIYPDFEHQLSEEQFLAVVYRALGFRGADPRGLFQMFDPAMYRGRRRPEDHFVSLFARKLTGLLKRAVARTTDRGRAADPTKFRPNPALGLLHERERPASEQAQLDLLPAVLACLDAKERAVVHLLYWSDLSTRKTGALLEMDHKTVARVHVAAVAKLRRLYGVEGNLAA